MKSSLATFKIIKLFTLLSVFTVSLHAHSGDPNIIWGFLLMGSIGLLLLSLLLRVSIKSNNLIYISLFLVIFFALILNINSIRRNSKISNNTKHRNFYHLLQEPNTYGVYKGNTTIEGTDALNIIFITINDLDGLPHILDNNKTMYFYIGNKLKFKIYVKELNNVTYFKNFGDDKIIFEHREENNNSIVIYSAVKKSKGEYIPKIIDYAYSKESTNYYLNKFNNSSNVYQQFVQSYESVTFDDIKKLEKTSLLQDPIVLINKENKQLQLYQKGNRKIFKPFTVPYTPKMSVYEKDSDKIFVVYEEVNGVYILENINTKEYTHVQNIVKLFINTSIKSFNQLATLKTHTLNKEQLTEIQNIMIKKPNMTLHYKINISQDQAFVYITSESDPLLNITFILNKQKQWFISDILYSFK